MRRLTAEFRGVWLACCLWVNAHAAEVFILKSGEGALYEAVVRALMGELKLRNPQLEPSLFSLTGNKADADLVKNLLARNPQVIVAIGTDAAILLKQQMPAIPPNQRPPVVFTLVLDPIAQGLVQSVEQSGTNFAGVALTVRPQRQFRALLDVCPHIKRIGVLYNPNDAISTRLIHQARDDAQKLGLQLVEAHVTKPEETQKALTSLKGQIEAFWLIPDPICASAQPFQQILAFTTTERIPLLAFSETYVRRGAPIAVGPDLSEQGVLAGELVQQILAGATPQTMPLLTPRRTLIYYNLIQARQIGITIPEMLLTLAEKVIGP